MRCADQPAFAVLPLYSFVSFGLANLEEGCDALCRPARSLLLLSVSTCR
jgi:hypothetical protein